MDQVRIFICTGLYKIIEITEDDFTCFDNINNNINKIMKVNEKLWDTCDLFLITR